MKKKMISIFLVFMLSLSMNIFGQYYSSISTSSPTFVSDLQTLIRSNYVKKSYDLYDENMIPSFYAQDNGNGTNSVFCVYSNYDYVYSGTFTWSVFSREHTWCYSWMPSNGSTSTNEYSDYHHLFPTHQNSANSVRSNHPLGNVVTTTSTFGDAIYGKDADGDNVYEPRDQQKGDAARALLYMSLKYDGLDGLDWDFNWLNAKLATLSEGDQSLTTLLEWHAQDPPDAWEIARNDHIQSLQGNRNPFIDHPEYTEYIDFSDLSKVGNSIVTEPTNHLTNLSASTANYSITLTWTDAVAGAQAPSGYLIEAFTTDDYFIPVDGTDYSNDLDFSDGNGIANVTYAGSDSYTFSNLDATKTYYFKILSYNGSGSNINYKTDGTIAEISSTVSSTSTTNYSDLIFTEYIEGSSNNKALEIYNGTGSNIDLSAVGYIIEIYSNGSSSSTYVINLTGTLNNNDVYVISNSNASQAILNASDQVTGSINFNGNDAIVLKKGSTILDVIGQVGFDPGTEWGSGFKSTADNTLRRKHGTTVGDTNPNDAFDPSVEWDGFAQDTFDDLGGSDPLPVELTSFSATKISNGVLLKWSTATEVNNYGFEIQTKGTSTQLSASWKTLGFVNGHGNSNSPKDYSFFTSSNATSFRLKQIDTDGGFEYSDIITISNDLSKTELYQNHPNPFNPSTQIIFALANAGNVNISVYNSLGQKVSELVNGNMNAGKHIVNFNANNLASGFYFYRLDVSTSSTKNYSQTMKMLLIK